MSEKGIFDHDEIQKTIARAKEYEGSEGKLSRRAKRRPRDERGWIIPKEGTLSRKIYDLLAQGKGTAEIAAELDVKVTSARVLANRIRNPEKFNNQRYNAQHEAA